MRQHTVILLVAAVLAAACGGEEPAGDVGAGAAPSPAEVTEAVEPTAEPEATATTEPAATATETGGATQAPQATGATVDLVESDLGEILADGEGRTLYLFLPDEQGASTCYDGCAQNWPPLEAPAEAGEGVDASLLATSERDDGTQQVTYNGWPLYYYAADAGPGEVNGQGVGDVWYVVDAAGEAVQAAGATETATPAAAGAGSGGGDEEDY